MAGDAADRKQDAGCLEGDSLHASAHKGLKAIHRCISSVSTQEAHALFEEVIRVAKCVR